MTYGDASAELRNAIGQLVKVRRTSVQLGGANGAAKAKAPVEETRAYTELILRFRAVAWDYPVAALRAALPGTESPIYEPAARLLSHLEAARPERDDLPAGRSASALELGSSFPYPLVNAWKRAAVAALVASERELPILRPRLGQAQRSLLILDASQVARALVRLDDRYHSLPGWQLLGGRATGAQSRPRRGGRTVRSVGLFSSALRCETWVADRVTDASYSLDHLGHRPEPVIADRDLGSGIGDAVTALANAWARLHHEFPSMDSMAATLRFNRLISGSAHRLALTAGEHDLADRFAARAATYLRLLDVTENVSGNIGRGQGAVADMTTAAKILDAETVASHEELAALSRAFDAIDAGFATLLEHGANDRFYFVTHRTHMAQVPSKGILHAVHWYVAITKQTHPAFFDAARDLRPAPQHRAMDASSVTGRESFRELIDAGFGRKRREGGPDVPVEAERARNVGPSVADAVADADAAAIASEVADLEPDSASLAM